MNRIFAEQIMGLGLGEAGTFENMTVFPLFSTAQEGIEYLTMKKALDGRYLIVTEVSSGGSVPELKVVNKADSPVLLIDGEELAGAKQNRVLNTAILLKERSETVIPVSCTEHGRWHHVSHEFYNSDVVMNPSLRARKSRSVSDSVAMTGRYRSDQGEVWEGVEELARHLNVHSETGAMRDVYKSKARDLGDYLKAFPCAPRQRGLLVFINGAVAGADILSREQAYADLHAKLVKSYALDAIVFQGAKRDVPYAEAARAFLEEARNAGGKGYPSVGHGTDYRFCGRKVVGSALIHCKTVIYAAIFGTNGGTEDGDPGQISNSRRRREYRQHSAGSHSAGSHLDY